MTYKLNIAPEAEADLARLLESMPSARRERALGAVREALTPLAMNPAANRSSAALGRPRRILSFTIDGTSYDWAATFIFLDDEQTIVITQFYRVSL